MRPTMRVLEMVGSELETTPIVSMLGTFEDRGQFCLLGVTAPETAEEGLAAEPGEIHGYVCCSAGTLVALGVANDWNRGLGRDALHLAVDVAVEHDVTNDQYFELTEATLKQVQDRVKFGQHERKRSPANIIASSSEGAFFRVSRRRREPR